MTNPLYRHSFDAQDLVASFPPRWGHRNKKTVYDISCPAGSSHSGAITVSRWAAMELPASAVVDASATEVEMREDVFQYEGAPEPNESIEWHLNFADSDLFVAYASVLMAQDELQVAEHPALGALKEAMPQHGLSTLTVESRQPTPILVRGVERRCVIHTDPNPAEGRPDGLYGNEFARAESDAVERATIPIVPPTTSNIIAIEAPSHGSGVYTVEQIEYVLRTAYTGFSAARLESEHSAGSRVPVVIHTGFWGCGAYGGNRVLMTLLQLVAAGLSSVDRLVFHTVTPSGVPPFEKAREMFETEFDSGGQPVQVMELLNRIQSKGFEWGVSDGN